MENFLFSRRAGAYPDEETTVTAIIRTTLAEQAYSDLRGRIMSGRLPAGARLLPEELALSLDISPTPIKEALVRLDHDGLVAMETRRGAVVRRFTVDDVTDLYEARQLIERHTLARGFAERRIDDEFVTRLRSIQAVLLAQRALGTEAGLIDALEQDRAFHRLIVSLVGNRTLVDWHERVMAQTHTVFTYSLDSYTMHRLTDEHAAIVGAIAHGDAAASHAALERHLILSRNDIISRLTDAGVG
jgi:DNA-binding GntR family transcriptional regulator